MLTQSELKELLNYNPETGVFTWVKKIRTVSAGDIAGGIMGDQKYVRISINGKKYLGHRLAWLYMTGEWPKHQVDHINHVRSDNRWINLREATNQENQKNASKRKDNKSGLTGVHWVKKECKWIAIIQVNKKPKCLGLHEDKFEAFCARLSANNKYGFHANHGDAKPLTKAEVMEFLENVAEVGE